MSDLTYKLGVWRHPTTGQARVYVQGGSIKRSDGDKVYFFGVEPTVVNPQGIDGRMQSMALYEYAHMAVGQTPRDIGLRYIDEALKERGWQNATFASIVDKLEGKGEIVEAAAVQTTEPTEAEKAEAAERAELLSIAQGLRYSPDEENRIVRSIAARLIDDERAIAALRKIKFSGSRRQETKAFRKDVETADAFAGMISSERLTPSMVVQIKNRIEHALKKRGE